MNALACVLAAYSYTISKLKSWVPLSSHYVRQVVLKSSAGFELYDC